MGHQLDGGWLSPKPKRDEKKVVAPEKETERWGLETILGRCGSCLTVLILCLSIFSSFSSCLCQPFRLTFEVSSSSPSASPPSPFLSGSRDHKSKFLLVYKQRRRTYPNQKILVFSQYLKFLDILEEALKRAVRIQALRFDGTAGQRQRLHVQQRFKDSGPEVPLLMTAGAGAYSLNITDTSIIIQCEIWWNLSVEWQAICRLWRQTRTSEILRFKKDI
ncbi:hypothetical protein NA56DRAFT_383508 [Hyaloscypha hepaticicola]|uniref:Helicase C-terminal domain-containing protein n=1 Tax=Hyaloscypha hepaticicola TaxID=2082293 RepID=A0A2J6QHG2_9HELO|nr:hypothetical protein NA56DRAFT_383508 [Hyaloscypha hepaticicola]